MEKYIALMRGIGPGNPNMRNDKLRKVLENLKFLNVTPVISSGNVIFESDKTDKKALESMIEKAWPEKLGFNSTTIVRSQKDLEKLIKANPFGDLEHGSSSYLLVTFFKNPTKINFTLPYTPPDKTYKLISEVNNTLFTVTDNTKIKTPNLMTWLEKQFGKQITSRTWKTVERIHKKMEDYMQHG
jgi:uncharacterized protein (DUF1697 family)